jgi:hypothetical protein
MHSILIFPTIGHLAILNEKFLKALHYKNIDDTCLMYQKKINKSGSHPVLGA